MSPNSQSKASRHCRRFIRASIPPLDVWAYSDFVDNLAIDRGEEDSRWLCDRDVYFDLTGRVGEEAVAHLVPEEGEEGEFADLRSCRAVPDNARTARPANRLSLDLAFYRDYTRDALHLLPSLETCLVRLTAEYLHHSALVSDLSQTAKRIKLEYERPPFELFYSRIEAKSPTVAILVASSRYEIGAPPLILRHNERDKGGTTYQLPRNEIDYQQHAALPSPKYEYFPDLVIPASGNCLVAAATPHIVQYPPAAKVAIERCELIHRAVFLLRSFWFLTSFDSLPTLLARTETFILSLPTSDAHGYAEIVSHPERFTPETIPLPGVPGGCIDARGRDTIAAPVEEEERERNDSEEGEEDGSEDADKRSDLFRTTARQSGVRIRW